MPARKTYLRTLMGAIVAGCKPVRAIGSKEAVSRHPWQIQPLQNVHGFGPEWRTRHDSNV